MPCNNPLQESHRWFHCTTIFSWCVFFFHYRISKSCYVFHVTICKTNPGSYANYIPHAVDISIIFVSCSELYCRRDLASRENVLIHIKAGIQNTGTRYVTSEITCDVASICRIHLCVNQLIYVILNNPSSDFTYTFFMAYPQNNW